MSEQTIKGIIITLAATGGIRLDTTGMDKWYNPPGDKSTNILKSYKKGDEVEITHIDGKIITIKKLSEAIITQEISNRGKAMLEKQKNKLPTVNIKGKNYVMVKDRVASFRDSFPKYAITTQILEEQTQIEKYVTIKAFIYDDKGNILATGHAMEKIGSSNINTTSHVENCETGAIGRALACFGIGIDEFASAEEVARAINQQQDLKKQKEKEEEGKYNDSIKTAFAPKKASNENEEEYQKKIN